MKYDITMKPIHGGLEKISIAEAEKLSDHPWFNRTLCTVNDAAVRIGVPKGVRHKPKAPNGATVLMVEKDTIVPTGS